MTLDDRTKALLSTFMLLWMKNNELSCSQTYDESSSDSDSDLSDDFSDSDFALEELSDNEEALFEEYRSLQEQQRKMQSAAYMEYDLNLPNEHIKIETEAEEPRLLEKSEEDVSEDPSVTTSVLQKRNMLLDEEDYDEPLEAEEAMNKKRKTE
ncbi:hypothetical protein K7432_008010 [Basidiobolus ranarum]|uniref:Uncharacterized protein n=1 Tax=Basidiobolus ranarum TaxID=34480 RepID=A0ABR2W064_9FUNG